MVGVVCAYNIIYIHPDDPAPRGLIIERCG